MSAPLFATTFWILLSEFSPRHAWVVKLDDPDLEVTYA